MGTTNPALIGIVPEVLTEGNYEYWKTCLKTYLIGQGLWGVVSGKEAKPEKTSDNYEIWKKKNAMALHAIHISIGADVVSKITKNYTVKYVSAKDAWEHLAKKPKLQSQPPQSPSSDEEGPTEAEETPNFLRYNTLCKAVENGDWKATKSFLDCNRNAVSARINGVRETALHVAVLAGHVKIVEELVKLMPAKALELRNKFGSTALSLAAVGGYIKMAKAIVTKNPKLVSLRNNTEGGFIPVIVASLHGRKEMVHYLYSVTPIDELSPANGNKNGATLLNALITAAIYDVALELLQQFPQLGITEDFYGGYAIKILAQKPSAFQSGSKLVFWKHWIYSCISVEHCTILGSRQDNERTCQGSPSDEENIEKPQQDPSNGVHLSSQVLSLLRGLVWNLTKCFVPNIDDIYDAKLVHVKALELLSCIFKEIPKLGEGQLEKIGIDQAIYNAIKHGIIEFIVEITTYYPETIWRRDKKGRTLFAHAIVLRQEKIFTRIYGLGTKKSIIARQCDIFDNNFLHLAGKLSPPSQLDRVSVAALQMQRELQWFKEVEKLVLPKYKEEVNENNKMPSDVFTEEHQDLMKEGEKWMKHTAGSCMVVATLIAAVMFTTAFTVPGGTNNETGVPIFLGYSAFLIFIVSDALSLFSSSTSVLMFLGIYTSRYAEEDFLESLPTKLIIGLSSLFFSIVTMMIAFGSALFLVLHEQLAWVSIPIIILATVPIMLFAILQFPLLLEMFICTYGHGIFDKPTKCLD